MKKFLIDTNYLLRFLLSDIPRQTKKVREFFIQAKHGEIEISVPYLAIIEADFNLTKLYRFSKSEVVEKLLTLISIPYLNFEKRELLVKAIPVYRRVNFDLVDILLLHEAELSGQEFLTFDKKLKNLKD